jgi:hypothetical protein
MPKGKLTIVQGDSGVGKTAFCCKLAAAVSIGGFMQDIPCEQGNVLMISVEDDPPTLKGRIEAGGGEASRCFFPPNAHELTFTHPAVKPMIEECGARLVIFDPIQAFLGKLDMHRANETRPIMAHLAALAKECQCAILLVSHMSKGSAGSRGIYRALGSVDIIAASRSALYVGRNPNDPEQCAVVHIKSSNAPRGRSILYRIGGRGGVQWEGYSDLTEDDLERKPEQKGMPYEDSPLVRFIKQIVAENPESLFLSWPTFNRYGLEAVGQNFGKDGRETKNSIEPRMIELARRDEIYITYPDKKRREREHTECGQLVQPSTNSSWGVLIEKRGQAAEVIL